jgi:trans-2,3-dihydro-3-hydroxyanthranilate isomerase
MNKDATQLRYYLLDVFGETKYSGNQLAVVRDCQNLSTEQMQRIAKEFNFSETTFITSETARDGGYDVRIFTPDAELKFAGHPTLGTAFVIREMVISEPAERVALNLGAGQIPVEFRADGLCWMHQKSPTFEEHIGVAEMARVLSLSDLLIDQRFPVQVVSTGTPFYIVPLKDMNAVRQAKIDRPRYNELIQGREAKAVYLFSSETYDENNDLNARLFADFYGVAEDAATGSAAGCLAGWLVKHRYFDSRDVDCRVEQGYEIDRQSLLHLKATESAGSIDVHVGGRVILTAQGTLL